MDVNRFASATGRYALAVASIALAVAARILLADLLGRESPFLLCLIAVSATAWHAGIGPALLATALGTIVNAIDASQHSIHPGPLDEILSVGLFLIIASALSITSHARRQAQLSRDRLLVQEREARLCVEQTVALLAASEERYRIASVVTNDALWDYDPRSGRIIRREGMVRVFHYKPEAVGEDLRWWANRIHPDDRDQVVRSFELLLAGDEVAWNREYRFRTGDESYAHVSDRAHVIRHPSGHPIRVIGSMLDITDLTRANQTLRQSQTFLHRVIRTVPAPIILTDSSGKIILFNRRAADVTGIKRRQAIGQRFSDLLAPSCAEAVRTKLADPFSPAARDSIDCEMRHPDGAHRIVQWRFAPLPHPESDLPYLLAVGNETSPAPCTCVQ